MFTNYFKTAIRNITRHIGYSAINVVGLAVGMACCILITMFVFDEINYDTYNEKAGRIYRVIKYSKTPARDVDIATVPAPLAKALKTDYPEVEQVMRFRLANSLVVKYRDKSFIERSIVFSDPEIFDIFTIHLLKGDPATALKKPDTLVLSKRAAKKYFGNQDPVGKVVSFNNTDDLMVTGVFDEIPKNSHFHYDVIVSMSSLEESREDTWLKLNFHTYVQLKEGADAEALEAKFPAMMKKYMGPQIKKVLGKSLEEVLAMQEKETGFRLQPLLDIHLYSDMLGELEPNGDIRYVYIFSAIALFVLVIASINFMNLATARSAGRAKEVGIRKVLGADRGRLIGQFLSESTILSVISVLFAIIMVYLVLPYFNGLTNKELTVSSYLSLEMLFFLVLITIITGLLAGSYPALYISAFQPAVVMKGAVRNAMKSGRLRSTLVIFQFATSIVLIIATLVIMNQLRFIQEKDLGYDKEQVLVLDNAYLLGSRAEVFKNEMLKHPEIQNATISGYLPVPSMRELVSLFPEEKIAAKESISMENWKVDYDYIKTMGMKIVEGRDFSRTHTTDKTAVIINREAAKQFGWDEPVGKRIGRLVGETGPMDQFTVIGVVEDFHFKSLKNTIGPVVLFIGESNELISFRIAADKIPLTIGLLREKWNMFMPGRQFEYFFMDERFDSVYRSEQRIGKIFGTFALLAIIIGCLGLFGLAAFTAEQRKKEIGIRKVLGATVPGIIRLLSKEFAGLLAIANVIAWPIAFYIMTKWLQDFVYKAPLTIWLFLFSGIAAVIVAMIAVGYQAVKIALLNPVVSIKCE